jgi:hypothetical protein
LSKLVLCKKVCKKAKFAKFYKFYSLRRFRRMLGLDPEMGLSPPSSPNNPLNEGNIRENIASEVENIPPLEIKIEGLVETLDQGFLYPFNPPLTDTSILVLAHVPSQFSTVSHQRYTPIMDEPTLGLLGILLLLRVPLFLL